MTGIEVDVVRCGAEVRRCTGCDRTVGSFYDVCPCGSSDFVTSTCRRLPMRGATRCDFHGAKGPQSRAKVAAGDLEHQAKAELARLGNPEPIGNPVEELLALAAERKAWLGIIRGLLPELDSLAAVDAFGVERAKAVVQLYRDAMNDSQRALEALLRLGLEERRVRISELQADVLAGALLAVLGHPDIGLEQLRQERARELLSAELEERSR